MLKSRIPYPADARLKEMRISTSTTTPPVRE
jgi:hypothetical protein